MCAHLYVFVFTHELCVNTVCLYLYFVVCLFFVGGGETLRKLR